MLSRIRDVDMASEMVNFTGLEKLTISEAMSTSRMRLSALVRFSW